MFRHLYQIAEEIGALFSLRQNAMQAPSLSLRVAAQLAPKARHPRARAAKLRS